MRLLWIFSIALVSMILITSQSPAAFAGIDEHHDADGDNYSPKQGDCDDTDPDVYPGHGCGDPVNTIEITSEVGNVDVGPNDVVTISNSATVKGNIKIQGGTLILSGGVTVEGNIESDKGATVVISGSIVKGNVLSKEDGSTIISASSIIEGNVVSDKEESIIIVDSKINGNIEVLNAKSVRITGNTVDGNLEITEPLGYCREKLNQVSGDIDSCP